MRKLVYILIIFISATYSLCAQINPPTDHTHEADSGIVKGTVTEIQIGDYVHLKIKDSTGVNRSFFVLLEDKKEMEKYWEGKYPVKYTRLKVYWKRETIQLVDSQKKMKVYAAIKIEYLPSKVTK